MLLLSGASHIDSEDCSACDRLSAVNLCESAVLPKYSSEVTSSDWLKELILTESRMVVECRFMVYHLFITNEFIELIFPFTFNTFNTFCCNKIPPPYNTLFPTKVNNLSINKTFRLVKNYPPSELWRFYRKVYGLTRFSPIYYICLNLHT